MAYGGELVQFRAAPPSGQRDPTEEVGSPVVSNAQNRPEVISAPSFQLLEYYTPGGGMVFRE